MKEKSHHKLFDDFISQSAHEEFPLKLARESLLQLRETSQSHDDYFYYLVEDAIFSSVYATFYEEILSAIHLHSEKMTALIDVFQNEQEERDQIVNRITQNHLTFLEKGGKCDGCMSCDNHSDLEEVINPFITHDVVFFEKLYLGMQTIQFSMEALIYEGLLIKPQLVEAITREGILDFRKKVFEFSEKSFS